MRWLALSVLLLVAGAPTAAPAAGLTVVSEGPAQVSAERLIVRSELVGREFQVDVWTPATRPWLPGQKAAAAYILDGGYGMAGPIAGPLTNTNAMQSAYIVTVGYPPGKGGMREVDLLYGPGTRPNGTVAKGGGGAAFTAFLVEELKPFIEARYGVDPGNAVLMGHSLAGIYTANVLARRPDAFAGYVIGSPSVWADPGIVARLAAAKPGATRPRVFVGWGGAEADYMVAGGRSLGDAVTKNSAFVGRAQGFEGGEHMTYYPALVPAGLGAVLPRKAPIEYPDPVTAAPEALARYAGTYRLSDGRTLGVEVAGGMLRATRADRPPLALMSSGPDRFFVPGLDIRVRFEGAAPGPATAAVVAINGEEARAARSAE